MAKIENLMLDLKSGGETYLRKTYTQEYNFIKIFFYRVPEIDLQNKRKKMDIDYLIIREKDFFSLRNLI